MAAPAESCQAAFARRWGHLVHPHVRALAWLLESPDLLDPDEACWQGKIASMGALDAGVAHWLAQLDRDPARLDASLGSKTYTRLGLYAEKLMAFYFREQGVLVAHGLQVRTARNDTIGEFDFLLDTGADAYEHIEFATKFYLLEGEAASRFDTFVGPNLADSLGAKMRKIIERQLALGEHPAAQALLAQPVVRARALVKGWLFYPFGAASGMAGITPGHCRGFWCALGEVAQLPPERYVVLPRLQWLAPYRGRDDGAVMDRGQLQDLLARQFGSALAPVMVASVASQDGLLIETGRGFVVPDDWRARAAQRRSGPD